MRNVSSAWCAHKDDMGTGESTQMCCCCNTNKYLSLPLLIQAQGTWTQSKWQSSKTCITCKLPFRWLPVIYRPVLFVCLFVLHANTYLMFACKLLTNCLQANYQAVVDMQITTCCWHANLWPVVCMQIATCCLRANYQLVVYKHITKLLLACKLPTC